jgi:hypothetical protein
MRILYNTSLLTESSADEEYGILNFLVVQGADQILYLGVKSLASGFK